MSSYLKYTMMGITTIVLPLGKWVLKKMRKRFTEKPKEDSASEEKD